MYQTALGIQEPERSYTTGNSPPLVSALLAARPQRGVRPFSYVCTDTNQFLVPQLMFSSSAQRGPHAAECGLLKSLAPGLSSLSNGGRFGKDDTSLQVLEACQNKDLKRRKQSCCRSSRTRRLEDSTTAEEVKLLRSDIKHTRPTKQKNNKSGP